MFAMRLPLFLLLAVLASGERSFGMFCSGAAHGMREDALPLLTA